MNTSNVPSTALREFFDTLRDPRADVATVRLALAAGLSPDSVDEYGKTALYTAVLSGFIDGARALIDAGANVNLRCAENSPKQTTPLHRAINDRRIGMIDLLLTRGADPRVTDIRRQNAAHQFINVGLLDAAWSDDQLLEAGALFARIVAVQGTANKLDTQNTTPLHLALGRNVTPEVVELLLENGADPEVMTSQGKRAIHQFWNEKNLWQLQKLLQYGADINGRDYDGASVLATAGSAHAVGALLEMGADLEHLDDLGRNALAIILDNRGVGGWRLEVCMALIDAGIDTTRPDYTGASVDSRLETMQTQTADPLRALISAKRAKRTMTSAIRKADYSTDVQTGGTLHNSSSRAISGRLS